MDLLGISLEQRNSRLSKEEGYAKII